MGEARYRRRGVAIVLAMLVMAGVLIVPGTTSRAETVTAVPALDREQLAKIFKRLEEAGRTRPIPSKVTVQLGLTTGDEMLTVREIAFERAEYQHGFYKVLRPGDDRIILAFRTPEKKWTAFLTDPRLKLIAAVSWNAGDTPERWQGAGANQAFDNELAYWATLAEIL